MSASTEASPRRNRREPEMTFLRLVPGTSVVHRMWAGTKLVAAAELALAVSISPTWAMIGVVAVFVGAGLLFARIPLGAFPRLPRWFLGWIALGALLNLWSAQHPLVHLGPFDLSIGGLSEWGRLTALTVVLIISGAVIGWTTPLGDVAPALSTLGRPLRWLRLPVDEWVVATALAMRCVPLLIDEVRTLYAARRLRAHDDADGRPARATVRDMLLEAHDLMATAIVVSIRRARDLADAMIARGGIGGSVSAQATRFGVVDACVLAVTTASCVVTLAVLHL